MIGSPWSGRGLWRTGLDKDADLRAEVEGLRRQIRQLLDREEIRRVKLQYCRYSDNRRFEDFATLFADDYRTEIHGPPFEDETPRPVQVFESLEAWIAFAKARGSVWSANAAHHIHGGEIEFTGPDAARAIWPSQFEGINGYHDEEYRRVDGAWKIARGRFFAQAHRIYGQSDYPYRLEVGHEPAD
jgi:hypothetical protein